MFIQIDKHGELTLEDVDNFKSFSIVEDSCTTKHHLLNQIATPAEENHYWLDAEAVIKLSTKDCDTAWVENFWAMLSAVEAYGYSNLAKKQVKAHLQSKP